MNFSEIPENPLIFLSWVTALGLFLSLSEATLKIKFEKINSLQKNRNLLIVFIQKFNLKYLRVSLLVGIGKYHLCWLNLLD